MLVSYSIALNNCEHFANYVLHGINLSSQQHIWWKNLGAEVISLLQPVQSMKQNYDSLKGLVRVIILARDNKPATVDIIDQLLANPIKLEDFEPFTRE